ncbi:MAG TPA: carbohydrate binding domain-containing protein [Chthonomonadaceae bacterium]|nr:carbohydrate binding domain-containing protein [Chthonomonadaceae bacterium]
MLFRSALYRSLRPGLIALALTMGGYALPSARGQAAVGQVQLRKEAALPGDFLYWFVSPTGATSRPKPLPSGAIVRLETPAEYNQPDAQLRVLDIRHGKIAHLALSGAESAVPAPTPRLGPNLLQNADFARQEQNWMLERSVAPESASLQWLGADAVPPGVGGRVARITVNTPDKENWHVQFYQKGLDLAKGEPYTLTFWARADRVRPLAVHANVAAEDGHGIGLAADQIVLTPEWRKLTFVFTPTRTLPGHNRLTFLLGDAVGAVDLAGLALQHGRAGRPSGLNLLRNALFAENLENWVAQSAPPPASATMSARTPQPAPPGVPSKAVHIAVAALGKENWHIQLYQAGLNLAEDAPYTLTFWARADRPRPLSVQAALDRQDWHNVGLNAERIPLTTAWQKFTLSFTAHRTLPDHNRLIFILGDALGAVDLAGLALQRDQDPDALRDAGGEPVLTLKQGDFRYAQAVNVPVRYQGRPVRKLTVALHYRDKQQAEYRIQPKDRGVARFSDVPLDEKLTFTVSDGRRTASFARIVAPDAPRLVQEISLPENWAGTPTLPGRPARALTSKPPGEAVLHGSHPLVGIWESRASGSTSGYFFTFNADGTGSIQIGAEPMPNGAPHAPVANPFRWYLTEGGKRLVIGARTYSWVIRGSGSARELVLTDKSGKTRVLYRR